MVQKSNNLSYIKNFFWLSLDFMSKVIIVTYANYYIFNSLSQSEYGVISFLNNIIFLLFPVISFGSNLTFLKRLSGAKKITLLNEEFSKGFSIRLVTSVVVFVILTTLYVSNIIETYVFILFITLCFELLYIYRELFLAKNKNENFTLSNFIADIFFLGLIFYLFQNNILDIFFLCLAYSLRSFIRLFLYFCLASFKIDVTFNFDFDLNYLKKIFIESYPLIFSTISSIFIVVLSQYLIKTYIGENELGIYSASFYLVTLLMTFFSIYSNSLVEFTFKNREEKSKNSKIIFLIFYLTIFIITLIILFGRKVLPYFLSETFVESIDILINFSPYILIICFKPIIDKILVFNNQGQVLAKRNIFNLVFTSLLIFLLLLFDYSYTLIPFCLFISELLILLSYNFFTNTKFIFKEIKGGILYFQF